MGNFDKLANAVLQRASLYKIVSCFPSLEEETRNFSLSNGNICRNFTGCKYQKSLISSLQIEETVMETNRKLLAIGLETFQFDYQIQSFLNSRQITICHFTKIIILGTLITNVNNIAGGDEPGFLADIILYTLEEWWDDLDAAITCYYEIYTSMSGHNLKPKKKE